MSRCEHGQHITMFCTSDSCSWRECAGCDLCFKKYHLHPTNLDTITLDKLQTLNNKLIPKPELKANSRSLQDAIYNYFMVMKSQINSSLDAVSRVLSNRISAPYLSQQDQLTIHKKIKTREYKKIGKKQLKSFCQFANNVDSQMFQAKQKELYFSEVSKSAVALQKIHATFKAYKDAVAAIDASFNVEKMFYEKILDITKSVQQTEKEGHSRDASTKGSQKQEPGKHEPGHHFLAGKRPGNKERKVSIDVGIGHHDFSNVKDRYKSPVSYDDNEKQIWQKKKKLLQMLSGSKKTQGDHHAEAKKSEAAHDKTKQDSQQLQKDHNLKKSDQKREEGRQRKKPSFLVVDNSIRKKIEDRETQNKEAQKEAAEDSLPANLFADLLEKGINLPQMIAHTILPAGQEKPKLYEDTKDVKETKITVPVKKFEESQEVSSPLLKKRRNNKGAGQFNLFSVEDSKTGELQKIVEEESPKKQPQETKNQEQQKQSQCLLLKQKQTDSLALLLESLRLPAEKAIPLLEASVKYASTNLSATEYLSYLYLQAEKPKQCLKLCNQMLEQMQDSPEAGHLSIHVSNNKAAALNMLGRYSESIPILQKCLQYAKKDIYYKNLGDAYFSIGIYEKAAYNYERAVQINPSLDEAYYNLAVCLFMQSHFTECKIYIQKALRLNRNKDYEQLYREVMIRAQA